MRKSIIVVVSLVVVAAVAVGMSFLPESRTHHISASAHWTNPGPALPTLLSPATANAADPELDFCTAGAAKCEEELAKLREIVKDRPKLPQPTAMTLDPKTTALLVLDLTNRCNDPAQVCKQIAPKVKDFLGKTRAAKVLTVYTLIFRDKDLPTGKVWNQFGNLPDEPVLAPDAFDKFVGDELQPILAKRSIKTVIITGASSNAAVLYTATTAASMYKYNVVIPVDGIIAKTRYIDEYSLYQFTQIPNNVSERFSSPH